MRIPNPVTLAEIFSKSIKEVLNPKLGRRQRRPDSLRTFNFYKSMCYVLVVLGYIPNEDKTVGLAKNLRLEIFTSPCDMS